MSGAAEGFDRTLHLGELAELHALGALEPHERTGVEAHVANCVSCARALRAAQNTVAALDDAFVSQVEPPERLAARIAASAQAFETLARRDAGPAPRHAARAAWRMPSFYATAAALLIAAGIGSGALLERSGDARQAAHDSAILATIATSHFNHVNLRRRTAAAPVSKVLYARDGAWWYVIVDSATCNCRVVAHSTAGTRDLGRPTVTGTTATLFVRDEPHPNTIELVGPAGQIVSDATLVYASR